MTNAKGALNKGTNHHNEKARPGFVDVTTATATVTKTVPALIKPFVLQPGMMSPTANINVGGKTLNVAVDAESPMSVFISGSPASNSYNFMTSSSAVMDDPFRYRDGSL